MKALPVGIVLVIVVLLAAGYGAITDDDDGDTIAADTIAADTIAADTIAADTIAADTIAADDDGEDAPYGTCTIGAASADVELTVDGYGAEAYCDELIRAFAERGDLWRRHLPDEWLTTICELEEPGGAAGISIRDSGGAYHAASLCAGWIAAGWFNVAGG